MLPRLALGLLLLALAAPATAGAAEPIMPLGDVRAGMSCTGASVVRGTEISRFDVEVIDVVEGDPTLDGPRILVRASGPAVDPTGIGPGFSGSPISCLDAAGTSRVIGAISESIGEYGGRVVLANPIEAILGTGVEAPAPRPARPGVRAPAREGARARRARTAALLARGVKPLAAPLTASGLSTPVARALRAAGRTAGRPVLAAPGGPLGSFPVQPLVPGAAMGVGYADGDISISAIGTVAYADEGRVWGFGHPFEGAGRRALLLQDAYVYRVISNPNVAEEIGTTYKLAAAGHAVGTLSNDALDAVVGRVGGLPSLVPVTAEVVDLDTERRQVVAMRVADETDVEFPTGPNLPVIAPLAVADGIVRTVRSAPPRLSASMCARIDLRERREPLRFCNRYVGGQAGEDEEEEPGAGTAFAAAADLLEALSVVDGYEQAALHVTGVRARVRVTRGQRQVALRSVTLPRRARAGQRVRARLTVQAPRGPRTSFTVPWRLPRWLSPGPRTLTFRLADRDERRRFDEGMAQELGDEEFGDGGEGSPGQDRLAVTRGGVEGVARRVGGLSRYDGLVVRARDEQARFYRDPELLITGRARSTVRVLRAQKR